jgi:tetratricopeptide (TPR) repeat protein
MKYRIFRIAIFLTSLTIIIYNLALLVKSPKIKHPEQNLQQELSDSTAGNYLAGYYAIKNNLTSDAAKYFTKLIAQNQDNEEIIKGTYLTYILDGKVASAIELIKTHPSASSNLILTISLLKEGNYTKAIELINQNSLNSEGLVDKSIFSLLKSWSYTLNNDYESALKEIDEISANNPASAFFERYNLIKLQKALISDFADKKDEAAIIYEEITTQEPNFLMVSLAGNFFERIKKSEKALNLYREFNNDNPLKQLFLNDIKRIENKDLSINRYIKSPMHAVNLLLSELANILFESKVFNIGLIYTQLGLYLAPEAEYANITMATYYGSLKDYANSILYYSKIPKDSFLYNFNQMNIADATYKSGEMEKANGLFSEIINYSPDNFEPKLIYAELLQENNQIEKSIQIYNDIINSFKEQKPYQWYVYYMRGFNYNLLKQSEKAEADLTLALKLNPKNSIIMNDLAYGWITDKKNLDQAEIMIKDALQQSGNSPEILDTMGWALFMKGKYDEASFYLEKASELLPSDATVFDHLGDAYWKIGNKIIARFEWQYALDNCKDPVEQARIQSKIDHGLK